MTHNEIFAAVMAIATQNPDGFTVNAQSFEPVTHGWAVACKETQNSFNGDGLSRVIEYVTKNNITAFGGWLDTESGLYYFDATIIVDDFAAAVELAKYNEQIAIFNLETLTEYRIK